MPPLWDSTLGGHRAVRHLRQTTTEGHLMDIGTVLLGIILLVVAWVCWTYLPAPLNILGGLIFGLFGLYFILVGLVGPLDSIGNGKHNGMLLPFLFLPMLRRRR